MMMGRQEFKQIDLLSNGMGKDDSFYNEMENPALV